MEKNKRTDSRPLVECGTKGHRRPSPGDPFQWVTSRECVCVLGAHFHGFFSALAMGSDSEHLSQERCGGCSKSSRMPAPFWPEYSESRWPWPPPRPAHLHSINNHLAPQAPGASARVGPPPWNTLFLFSPLSFGSHRSLAVLLRDGRPSMGSLTSLGLPQG